VEKANADRIAAGAEKKVPEKRTWGPHPKHDDGTLKEVRGARGIQDLQIRACHLDPLYSISNTIQVLIQTHEFNAMKLQYVRLKIECQRIFHAALHPKLYPPKVHTSAVKAVAMVRSSKRAAIGKKVEKQCEKQPEENAEQISQENSVENAEQQPKEKATEQPEKDVVVVNSAEAEKMAEMVDMHEMVSGVLNFITSDP